MHFERSERKGHISAPIKICFTLPVRNFVTRQFKTDYIIIALVEAGPVFFRESLFTRLPHLKYTGCLKFIVKK